MNEAALRQIDVLIRHGMRLPLSTYVMLREAEKRGFEIELTGSYSDHYRINVTIDGMKFGKARKLTVDQMKFVKALNLDSRAYMRSWKKGAKNSTKTIWFFDSAVRPSESMNAELGKIAREERDRLDEQRERDRQRDEAIDRAAGR